MNQLEYIRTSIPNDVALKIASSLQVKDVCALGSCSRFWSELCGSDYIWESLSRERWPFLGLLNGESSSSLQNQHSIVKGWKSFYVQKHNEMAFRAGNLIKFVEQCMVSDSLAVGDYLKAIEELSSMQLGYKDVEILLLKPNLSVFLNLIGLHYCINWLGVPAQYMAESLQTCKISERQVHVKWWKLGRWFYGFRMRDESHSRLVSLEDLATAKEAEVLWVLQRGAIHEVLQVQISTANSSIHHSCQGLLGLR
ncbi:uncharacterized protein LOC110814250 [Carica papaya]|uniref:uncharacterized protein LOC110814250 n=1 Tax=Carica papaya TaxID=3649 RepID=UPI000B8CDC41|nr:uncharacterized protein LOC110814250 [Carica papaya]